MFTRSKLNSIRYGPRLLAAIGVLTIALPLALHLGYEVLRVLGLKLEVLRVASTVSMAAGIGVTAVFALLLVIEFAQDRWLDRYYDQVRRRKVKISDVYYECQYCGSQTVREADRRCPCCGRDLI